MVLLTILDEPSVSVRPFCNYSKPTDASKEKGNGSKSKTAWCKNQSYIEQHTVPSTQFEIQFIE